MNNHTAEFRRCLTECDVKAIRELWKHVSPHLPQPLDDREALATIHYARTQSVWLDLRSRAYSHNWLLDHNLPSGLPDNLKPKAERMYPRIVEGVGIAVETTSEIVRPALNAIRQSMSDAVMDAYSSGHTDPIFVKERIMTARKLTIRKLFGNINQM